MRFAPKLSCPVLIAVGDAEPPGWQAQSVDFHQACRDAGTPAHLLRLNGANHFTIKFAQADPTGPLGIALLRQCGLR